LRIFSAKVVLGLMLIVSCIVSAEDLKQKVVGKWKTNLILSQLGRLVVWYEFSVDGTFKSKLIFFDADIPDEISQGTYEILGDKLRTITKIKTHTSDISFANSDLVIDDGNGEKFQFKKIE